MNHNRLDRLYSRRVDPNITNALQLNEVYKRITQSDSVKYVLGAMQPIDPEYTKATFSEGDRVWNQLDKNLNTNCEKRYQGSVTNDTHIKAKSDIDLLTITKEFYTLEVPQVPSFPYYGNTVDDLLKIRNDAIEILRRVFPEATVDHSGAKSITIDGGSLRRKVDVVPCNWHNTNLFSQNGNEVFRGIEILDAKNRNRILNTPFYHNALIDVKDKSVNGNLRKAARLMKSLKYDTESIELSSYDIVSIAYNIDTGLLNIANGLDLTLLESCYQYCQQLLDNEYLRSRILVPDGHRAVFADGHASKAGLLQLIKELGTLRTDVVNENQRSFQKLNEARVYY